MSATKSLSASASQLISSLFVVQILFILQLLSSVNYALSPTQQQQQQQQFGSRQLASLVPTASSFTQLARSPASLQLASEFFALERERENLSPSSRNKFAQENFQLEKPHYSRALSDAQFRLDQYHSLDQIYAFMDALSKRYKSKIQVFTIGRTQENRPVKALELINNASDSDFVWLDSLTHAREWITGSTLLYILDELVAPQAAASRSSWSVAHAKNYIIIPVVNPDGYSYTWTTNRMWRKNRSRSRSRSPLDDNKCVGADLNRNFDHSFGSEGSSRDPCSHIYSGAFPFSEPETRALADLLWSLRDRIKFYLTIHSYSQLWACPYAYTTDPSAHLNSHMRVLRAIQRAVFEAEGVQYEIGPLSTSLYVGSGFGIDFAYDKCGIQHSYLVELRDKGAHGFILPAEQIMPTARETFAGLRAGLKQVFAAS